MMVSTELGKTEVFAYDINGQLTKMNGSEAITRTYQRYNKTEGKWRNASTSFVDERAFDACIERWNNASNDWKFRKLRDE